MNDTTKLTLETFLRTDPRDVGCERALAVLHIYAELTEEGRRRRMPGVEAHLRACAPCSEDYQGLLAAITSAADDL